MKRDRSLARILLPLVAGAVPSAMFACASHDDLPTSDERAAVADRAGVSELEAKYPGAADLLVASGPPAVDHGTHIELRTSDHSGPVTNGAWASSGRALEVVIEPGAGAARVFSSPRGRFTVTRTDDAWAEVGAEQGAVVARDADESIDTLFIPRDDGLEELVQLAAGDSTIDYDITLPPGWKLHARSETNTVEILDDRGGARFRVRADLAWDAAGRELSVTARVEGSRLKLGVMGEHSGRILVDPLWQDAGSVAFVRRSGASALLPNGRVLITGGVSIKNGEGVVENELFDPRTLTFSSAASLHEGRIDHLVVTLPNGKVLVAGGFAQEVAPATNYEGISVDAPGLASAEIYDPVSDEWTVITPMLEGRGRASATLLHDGRVLITGGTSGGSTLTSAEIFDPTTLSFASTSPMPEARQEHAATLLADGRVLLTGGTDGASSLATTTIFEESGVFSAGPALTAPRYGHMAVGLPDGRLLVMGGKKTSPGDTDEHNDVLDSAEVLDTTTSPLLGFTAVDGAACSEGATGSLSVERYRGAATLVPSGQVLVAGGLESVPGVPVELPVKGVDLFDPATNCFKPIEESIFLTLAPSLVVLPSGKVLLAGRSPSAQLLDATRLGTATITSFDLPEPRANHTMTLLATGEVLVVGGEDNVGYFSDAFKLDASGVAAAAGDMMHVRSSHTATRLFDGTVLIAGGSNQTTIFDSAEVYDPDSEQFEVVGPMSSPRALHTSTLLPDGRVLLIGGFVDGSGTQVAASADLYDPRQKTFSPVPLNIGRAQHAAALLTSGDVLVAGGTDQFNGSLMLSAELFDSKNGVFVELGGLKEGRREHKAVPLPDGRILMVAGAPTGSSEIYDPVSQTFSFAGPMVDGRAGVVAFPLPSGNVVAIGGYDDAGEATEIEIFDPLTETWHQPTAASGEPLAIQTTRAYHGGALLADGRVLIAGGAEPAPDPQAVAIAIGQAQVFSEDIALGLSPARPVLGSAPSTAEPGSLQLVTGSSLHGFGEIGGGTYASNSRFPVALWLPLDGAFEVGAFTQWSDQTADWLVPAPRYPGPGLLFAVANGLRSNGLSVTLPPADQGLACTTDSQCKSGFCTDGVCCDQLCDAGCMACAAAVKGQGDDGVCEPVVAETDPKDACPELAVCLGAGTGVCDGAGTCVGCPPPTTCDGDHTLIGASDFTEDCSPFKCDPESNTCLNRCTWPGDCVSGLVCDAGGACVPPPMDDRSASCAATPDRPFRDGTALALLLGAAALRVLRRPRRRPLSNSLLTPIEQPSNSLLGAQSVER